MASALFKYVELSVEHRSRQGVGEKEAERESWGSTFPQGPRFRSVTLFKLNRKETWTRRKERKNTTPRGRLSSSALVLRAPERVPLSMSKCRLPLILLVRTAGVDLGCIRKSPCSAFPILDKCASCKKGFNVFILFYLHPHLPFHMTAS